MAFSYVFATQSAVIVGAATRASNMNAAFTNVEAAKERIVINHYWNNTGVVGEDGFVKADYNAAGWFYAKNTGGATAQYFCFYLDPRTSTDVRLHMSTTTAAPTATQGHLIMLATGRLL